MWLVNDLVLTMWNVGVFLSLAFGAMILLRPVTNRLLAPQQRAWLWWAGWFCFWIYTPLGLLGYLKVLPFTFRDLVVVRTGGERRVPAILPPYFNGDGTYHIALPGGTAAPVRLSEGVLWAAVILWVAGIVLMLVLCSRREKAQAKQYTQGRLLERGSLSVEWPEKVSVRLCQGLRTSYVCGGRDEEAGEGVRYVICLQDGLPRERMELILRHELAHIRLRHIWMKTYLYYGIIWAWWSPVIWLACRLTCRDMELACDQAVLSRLDEGSRREYARTLVELGSGKHLWNAPMSFGECDAAIRVRKAVAWKPWRWWTTVLTWGATALLALFLFTGGPTDRALEADLAVAWQRETAAEGFWDKAWRWEEELPQLEEVWWKVGDIPHGDSTYDGVLMYAQDRSGTWWTWDWVWFEQFQDYTYLSVDSLPLGEAPDLAGCARMDPPGEP